MRCTRLVMVALAACAATASGARAAKVDVYALVGARVVPVSGPVLENGTVLLRDGVIEAVGARVTLPLDARVIDAKGLTVTPGLIDAFGGLGLPAAAPHPPRAAVARGRPGRRRRRHLRRSNALQPQALAIDRVRPAEALRARDQGLTTALAIGREGVLPGRSVLLDAGSGSRPEAPGARSVARAGLGDGAAAAGGDAPAHGDLAAAATRAR